MPSSEIQLLREERERLRQDHVAGASGLAIARALAEAVDRVTLAIWAGLDGADEAALVALGGYGRGELSPASDVDLIVLHHRRHDVTQPAKALSYRLWDAGLELGYAIFTPKEAIRLARQRIDSETSLLDARLLTGNAELFAQLEQGALDVSRRSIPGFLARLRQATLGRRTAAGDAGAELEPNLKEGRGGLRDLATIRWIEGVCGRQPLSVAEGELIEAADFLHRVRNQLHFMTGRRTDVLLMQHQPAVAGALTGGRGDVAGEDELMRAIYGHCRKIAFALDAVLFPDEGRRPTAAVLAPGLPVPWPAEARRAFVELLSSGAEGRSALHELDQRGVLSDILPEWEGIRLLPQRNVYHRYAVDVHSFEVTAAAAALAASTDALVRQVALDTGQDRETLLLAALLHDVGKGGGDDHAVRGEELARSAVGRIGLEAAQADDVAWLVRNHLLLAQTAARRDIGDERLVVELAETVGSERRLRLLFLLTVADGLATGPSAWGAWKATLVSRLFTRVNRVLEAGELVGGEASPAAHERMEELREALARHPAELVEAHLENMPRAWLLSQPLLALVHQSGMMIAPLADDEVRLDAALQDDAGIWEATIVARDCPGLFSKVSGCLALHGLNVAGAHVYTREDGVALEVFRLEALGDEDRRFERVKEDIRKALRGRLALDVRLAEKRRDYAGRPGKGKREPPQVVVDNRASDFNTVIEVHATDRVGLLHAITRALADMELDIHMAKVATYAEDVVDVFYIRDLEGQKVTDADHVREIERTILHRLGEGG